MIAEMMQKMKRIYLLNYICETSRCEKQKQENDDLKGTLVSLQDIQINMYSILRILR